MIQQSNSLRVSIVNFLARQFFSNQKYFSILITFFLISENVFPAEWVLEKNSGGISVYTRRVSDSSFKEYRAETIVETSLTSLVALLNATEDLAQWVDRLSEAKVLKRVSDTASISRSVTKAPWPLKNRETIFYGDIKQNLKTGQVVLSTKAMPNYLPLNQKYERVTKVRGKWVLTPMPNGRVKVVHQGHTEPGGVIPATIANQFVVVIPYNTLKGLRKQVFLPKYQKARISYIKELTQ